MKKIMKKIVICMLICLVTLVAFIKLNQYKSKADNSDYALERRTHLSVDKNGALQVSRNPLGDIPMGKDDTWTIFVYMCGSDLESNYNAASTDIKEMIAGAESDNVNIVIQTGGSYSWNKPNIESDKIGRYIIKNNKLELVESHPDANMGEYTTLKSFLNWGVKKYPAKNMGVILWNHGAGTLGGVCCNEKYDYDALSMSELELALECVSKNMTDKFEMIGFDACLMSTIEIANMLTPYANYLVSSQQSEPCDGWEYTSVINTLVKNPSMNGEELGKVIVDAYAKNMEENQDIEDNYYTLSLTDLSKVDNLVISFNNMAKSMDEVCTSGKVIKQLNQAAIDSLNIGSGDYEFGLIDLYDYMSRISSLVNGTEDVKKAIEDAIIHEKHGTESTNAHGITFYYPTIETGFIYLNQLRNTIVSPYYMNFIDKRECYITYMIEQKEAASEEVEEDPYAFLYEEYFDFFGDTYEGGEHGLEYTLDNYSDNNWENSTYYYYETSFGYMEYEFTSPDEYIDMMDIEYFSQVQFDDKWYEMYY